MSFNTIKDIKEHFDKNKYAAEVHEAINFLLMRVNDVEVNEFVGLIISDFYCNGFFGRRYDLTGCEIIENGTNYITIKFPDGEVDTSYFEVGWQLQEMRELINKWTN